MPPGGSNPFEALPNSETRAQNKRERAAEHASAQSETCRRGDDTCMPSQASGTDSGQKAGQSYSLALAADNLLVALEAGSGRQVACFTISGPEQAVDPAFQSWLRQQLEGPAAVPSQHAQHAQRALAASASAGAAGPVSEDEELAGLLHLMMVGDSSSLTSAAAAAEGGGAAAPRAAETSALSSARQHPSSPAELWFDALEEPATGGWQLDELEWRQLQQQAGEGWGAQQRQQHSISWQDDEAEDWRLAALLQAEEDASVAPAAAEQAEASVAGQQLLQLSDWRLAQRFQEEEDARMAAALAEQDRAAGTSAAQAVAQQSSSFWARLHPGGGASVAGGCGVSEAGTAPAAASDSFPALQAQLPADQLAATRAERTRRQLLSEHRQAKQAAMQRGSSVRLLRRVGGAGSPAASPVLAATAVLPSSRGSDISGGLPPLQLDGGLVLHEDDLDYQLLLRDDDVTTAARVAAIHHVDMSEAAGPADAAGPTSAAMRIMIDAAARRAAAGAGGTRPGSAAGDAPLPAGTGRPASSASGEVQGEAVGQAAAPMPPAAPAGPSAAVAAEGAGPAVDSTAPVDTKSLRRLIEDMKRRGWQLLGSAGGGHLRCERVLHDLPGFKQVYFLCSTPSDVNYIWNVAAAVKRFDREVEERRAEASAAAPAGSESAGGSGGAVDGRSMPYRLRR